MTIRERIAAWNEAAAARFWARHTATLTADGLHVTRHGWVITVGHPRFDDRKTETPRQEEAVCELR